MPALALTDQASGPDSRLVAANLVFLGFAVLFLLLNGLGTEKVLPLVQADTKTTRRIEDLERMLQRDPGSHASALELAQLYRDAGEFPFSYDALRSAEVTGTQEPGWRLRLGLAYLQLGKNDDAVRVLERALAGCAKQACGANVRTKLEIFGRVARLFQERKIQPHKQRIAAEKALQEVLKPVEVDPRKMRAKAPATPPAAKPAPARGN